MEGKRKMRHEIRITIKRSIFGVILWKVVKITHFNRSERLELIYRGVSLKSAIKKAMGNRDHKTPSILEISG
jgi:hypothetical protein